MTSSRREILTTLSASLLAGGGLGAAGCGGRANRRSKAGGLDVERLSRGFAPLAERARPGVFTLGVMRFEPSSVWTAEANRRFPMLGLFMAPLAAAALAEVDAGRLRLNETIRIARVDLAPPPSRIDQTFPVAGVIDLPAADLIALAVQAGDATAADAVMGRIGGPGAVTAWLRSHGISDMRVDRYERELQPALYGAPSFRAAWKDEAEWAQVRGEAAPEDREAAMIAFLADPRDTTTAQAALGFLDQLAAGALLSTASTSLLLRLMGSGDDRAGLGAGLPRGARWAHQAGTAATDLGVTAVDDDMGIATLQEGRRLAIAAFLAGSTATARQRQALFADAARLAVAALK